LFPSPGRTIPMVTATARRDRMVTPPERWRVIVDGARDGASNMATDHALATALGSGEGVLRLYTWDRPTLSFGRNEPARELYDAGLAEAAGVGLVRRPTGGRAVLHGQELTYAVVVGMGALGGMKEAYRRFNEALVDAMTVLGVPASLAPEAQRVPGPDAGPCFDVPAPGEVTAAGRKLVGSAQVRIGRSILQHGSIILAGDQGLIEKLGGPRPAPPATLASLLGTMPDRTRLDEAIQSAFARRLGGTWTKGRLTREETAAADRLLEKYRDPAWTWRR
jgi:lipoate-protein ligase A